MPPAGHQGAFGPVFRASGMSRRCRRRKSHPHYSPRSASCRAGRRFGFWFNAGGESSAQVNITRTATSWSTTGIRIGGSRARSNICASCSGIDYKRVSRADRDTATSASPISRRQPRAVCFRDGGEQSTERSSHAEGAREDLGDRPRGGEWENGAAHPASQRRQFEPLTLAELAAGAADGRADRRRRAAQQPKAPRAFRHHISTSSRSRTRHRGVIRYTGGRMSDRRIHRYVEGQMQAAW